MTNTRHLPGICRIGLVHFLRPVQQPSGLLVLSKQLLKTAR